MVSLYTWRLVPPLRAYSHYLVLIMTAYDSADARTDGVKSPKPTAKGHDALLSLDRGLAMRVRGRTIYNANLMPSGVNTDSRSDSTRSGWLEGVGQISSLTALEQLEKIDAEETKRKELFTGCSACSGRYLTQEGVLFWNDDDPTTGSQVREGDDTAVREMFDMYIRVDECMG